MTVNLPSTLSPDQAAGERWDAIVVGAGVAGTIAASGLARAGHRVLIIEKSSLPRSKVCGACLNQDAIAGFRAAKVWRKIERLGGIPLDRLDLRAGDQRTRLSLPVGHAVSRWRMDRALAEAAIESGAEYLDQTSVSISDHDRQADYREIIDRDSRTFRASALVIATGLTAPQGTPESKQDLIIRDDSRIGLGAWWHSEATSATDPVLQPGVIYMNVAASGYVGMVLTERGQVNMAAAIDRATVQTLGPASACESILAQSGWDLAADLNGAAFRGTPSMTRRRMIAGGYRLFYAGDSSGYVEPFTGEGMAWAIRSGNAVTPWIEQAIDAWNDSLPQLWTSELQRQLGKQRRRCQMISRCLRHPFLVRQGIKTISRFPRLGRLAVGTIQREQPVA